MMVVISTWEHVAVDSGLWPETAFRGMLISFNKDTVDIDNYEYGEMVFLYRDIESIKFDPVAVASPQK